MGRHHAATGRPSAGGRWAALTAATVAAVLATAYSLSLPAASGATTTPAAQLLHADDEGGAPSGTVGRADKGGSDKGGRADDKGGRADDKGEGGSDKGRGAKGEGKGAAGGKKGRAAQGRGKGAERGRAGRVDNPGTKTKTIRYGPYTVPAAVGDKDGRTKNKIEMDVQTPCEDCFLTRLEPRLVYPDGTEANVDTGPGLHHFVMLNKQGTDATCGGSFPNPSMFLGERFAAAGNERTVISFPEGYGYPSPADTQWNMISDLMNHAEQEKEVFIEVEYDYVPRAEADTMTAVRPVWLDIASCTDLKDTYTVPEGTSTKSTEWEVNVPGRVVSMGGHLHNDGVTLTATNEDTGQVLCDSKASYGDTAGSLNIHGEKELATMKTCIADPLGSVKRGQKIKLTSTYDASVPRDDVMGIMVTYIAEK